MKDTLEDMIRTSSSNQAKLIEMGVPREQALRIAFGTEFTNALTETGNNLNLKAELNEQDSNGHFNLSW
jgi:hypothetical protein